MKVFLANPPWLEENKIGHRAGARFPYIDQKKGKKSIFIPFPFFLSYAAAVLKENDIEVMLVDSVAEGDSYDDFFNKMKRFKPDLILIEISTPSIFTDLEIAKKLKNEIEAKIVFSGPHMYPLGVETLKNNEFIDYGIFGEYEYTLLDLVKYLENGKDMRDINGLIFREDGNVRKNKERNPIMNLDELPWPAREFLPMYNYYGIAALPTPQVQMITSRGCPYKCIFCVYPITIYGSTYRVRDSVKVVDEMEWLIEKYKFKSVYFFDDCFNIGKQRILKLTEEIKKRGIDIVWGAQMRPDLTDKETLISMKNSGFRAALLGVESGSLKIQKNIKKSLDLNKVRTTMKWFHELGLKAHLTFTIGLPEENKQTVQETLNFIKELKPYSAQFSITTPFPGTEYFDLLEKKGYLLTKDWSKYVASFNSVLRTEELTAQQIAEQVEWIKREWDKFNFLRMINQNKFEYFKKGIKNPRQLIFTFKRLIKAYSSG